MYSIAVDAIVSFAVDAVSQSEAMTTLTVQITLDAMTVEAPISVPITAQSGTASEYPLSLSLCCH